MLLHCDAVQAHIESHIGLVETRIGVVPGWGGCKEMLLHHLTGATDPGSQIEEVEHVFYVIADAHTSASAEDARDMHIIRNGQGGISMHRDRLLADAKALCQQLADGYITPDANAMPEIPSAAIEPVLQRNIEHRREAGSLTDHDVLVLQHLAFVLSHGTATPDVAPGAWSLTIMPLNLWKAR
jgi:3-hydroxyacyl-CoA dehydrogenase